MCTSGKLGREVDEQSSVRSMRALPPMRNCQIGVTIRQRAA